MKMSKKRDRLTEEKRSGEGGRKQTKPEAQTEAPKSVPRCHVLFKTLFLDSPDSLLPLRVKLALF